MEQLEADYFPVSEGKTQPTNRSPSLCPFQSSVFTLRLSSQNLTPFFSLPYSHPFLSTSNDWGFGSLRLFNETHQQNPKPTRQLHKEEAQFQSKLKLGQCVTISHIKATLHASCTLNIIFEVRILIFPILFFMVEPSKAHKFAYPLVWFQVKLVSFWVNSNVCWAGKSWGVSCSRSMSLELTKWNCCVRLQRWLQKSQVGLGMRVCKFSPLMFSLVDLGLPLVVVTTRCDFSHPSCSLCLLRSRNVKEIRSFFLFETHDQSSSSWLFCLVGKLSNRSDIGFVRSPWNENLSMCQIGLIYRQWYPLPCCFRNLMEICWNLYV